ncbi:MAG: glycosyltransferase [Candidatus Eiseniibacteriota bacterium]
MPLAWTEMAAPGLESPDACFPRVLWVTHVYPRDPSDLQGLFLHRLARELPRRGFQLRVVAPGAAGAADEAELDGVQVRRFHYPAYEEVSLAYTGEMHRVAIRRPILFSRFLLAMRRAVAREARAFAPQLTHCHWWFPAGLALRASFLTGVDYCVSLHGTDVRLLSRSLVPWPAARWVIAGANRVLPVSNSIARELTRLRLAPRRCEILPMPADEATFAPGPLDPAAPPSFVVPARLVGQKRIDVALRALRWARDHGTMATLHLVGEGEKRAELVDLVSQQQLSEQVVFHGFVPQPRLAELFRGARAVVLTSRDEGYGLVLVEAALCQRPAIGVRSGAITDFVTDGETGILVQPGDHVALGQAMGRLAGDATEVQRLGANARQRALLRTAGPLADQLARSYRQTIGDTLAQAR